MKKFLWLLTVLCLFVTGCGLVGPRVNTDMLKKDIEGNHKIDDRNYFAEGVSIINVSEEDDMSVYEVSVSAKSSIARHSIYLKVYYDTSGDKAEFEKIEEIRTDEWSATPLDVDHVGSGKLAEFVFESSSDGGYTIKQGVEGATFYNWNRYSNSKASASSYFSSAFSKGMRDPITVHEINVASAVFELNEEIEFSWVYDKEWNQIPGAIKSVSHTVKTKKDMTGTYYNGSNELCIKSIDGSGVITGSYNGTPLTWQLTGLFTAENTSGGFGDLDIMSESEISVEGLGSFQK